MALSGRGRTILLVSILIAYFSYGAYAETWILGINQYSNIADFGVATGCNSGGCSGSPMSGGTSNALLQQWFNNPNTYMDVNPGGPYTECTYIPNAHCMIKIDSWQGFAGCTSVSTCTGKNPPVPSSPVPITAVQYDNEKWPNTPQSEQDYIWSYSSIVAAWARLHGLIYIPAPGLDITGDNGTLSSYCPGQWGCDATRFYYGDYGEKIGVTYSGNPTLPPPLGRIFSIQAQSLQSSSDTFNSFLNHEATQIMSNAISNGGSIVTLGGLTSGRTPITGLQFYEDAVGTCHNVSGDWLNILPGNITAFTKFLELWYASGNTCPSGSPPPTSTTTIPGRSSTTTTGSSTTTSIAPCSSGTGIVSPLSNSLIAYPGIIMVGTSSNVSFAIGNVVATLGNCYSPSNLQKDTFFVIFANTVQPPQNLGSVGGAQCSQYGQTGWLVGWSSVSNACWFHDPTVFASCNSGAGGTCQISNFTNTNDYGGWPGVNHYAQYCAYFDSSGNPSSATLASCTTINITKVPSWSYGLTLVPSVTPPQQFREGSTIMIKIVAMQSYSNPIGTKPEICPVGDLCYIGFAGTENSIAAGRNLGASAAEIAPTPGFSCSGAISPVPTMALYSYTPPLTVPEIISAINCPGGGGGSYLFGTTSSGSETCMSVGPGCGTLPSYSCPLLYWSYNPSNSVAEDSCILNGYTTNTYGNSQNFTYEQPFDTQYLGTGNYLVYAVDYSNYCSVFGLNCNANSMYFSPFFASMSVDCANGYCTAFPNPQEVPNSLCPGCAFGIGPGGIGVYNSLNPNSYAGIACGVYGAINDSLFIFALLMMLLGAVLYSGSTLLPGAGRGPIQSYGTGFIMVGVIAALIAVIGVYALSSVNQTSLVNAISLCRA